MNRPRIVFVDPVATSAYDGRRLRREAMGGTEATVVRVAEGLASHRPVTVAQAARTEAEVVHGVEYVPWEFRRGLDREDVGAVVVVRAHKVLKRIRRRNPNALLFLWMHCFPGKRLRRFAADVCRERCTLLAVSDHHNQAMREFIRRHDPESARRVRIRTVYNPIDDRLVPDGTRFDPNALTFLSSPHKGLDQVLDAFRHVRSVLPQMRLYVANPGYLDRELEGDLTGVVRLGKLPHDEAVRRVRSSLCLFYSQDRFAETFGLVFAEANAVGTPVLTHPVGSAQEVVCGSREQLVDALDHEQILERVARWRAGWRPRVRLDQRFRLPAVIARWHELLEVNVRVNRLQRTAQAALLF